MPTIRAVTFDAYNTLFDFSSNALPAVRALLPEEAVGDIDSVWQAMNSEVVRLLDVFIGRKRADFPQFVTLDDIHRECFSEVQRRLVPSLDVDAATDAWNRYISGVPLFDDAGPAAQWCVSRLPTAIVSDIDTRMLEENPHRQSLPIEHAVTSEQDGAYKAMTDCTMFQTAAGLLGCSTAEILHVGDSSADIVGAKRAGARAVWLNRATGRPRNDGPEADAEIASLDALPELIERLGRARP